MTLYLHKKSIPQKHIQMDKMLRSGFSSNALGDGPTVFMDSRIRVNSSKFSSIFFKDDVIQTKNSEDQALLIYGAQSHIIVAKDGFRLWHLETSLSLLLLRNEIAKASFLNGI